MRTLTPIEMANLERVFAIEYKRRIKAGEPAPYASMMAARAHCIEHNRLMKG
jgi:hypothetical protein